MAGKLLFPAFPRPRALPWLLGGGAGAVAVTGLIRGDHETAILGIAGVAGALVAFPLANLIVGRDAPPAEPDPDANNDAIPPLS